MEANTIPCSLTRQHAFILRQLAAFEPNSEPALFAAAIENLAHVQELFSQLAERNPRYESLTHMAQTVNELLALEMQAASPNVYYAATV